MFERIIQLVKSWCCEDKASALIEAITVLERHGDTTVAVGISAVLEGATAPMGTDVLDELYRLIHVAQDTVFHAFSIDVADDFHLRTVILTGLLHVDNFDDAESILQLIENSMNPVDTFADLMELITCEPADTIHTVLLYVSPSLLAKLVSYYQPKVNNSQQAVIPVDSAWVDRVRKFVKLYPVAVASRMVTDDQTRIGTRLDTLLSWSRLDLGLLEPGGPQQAAIELVGLCLISDIGVALTVPAVKGYIEQLWSDIDFITQLTNSIDSVCQGVFG